MKKFIYLCIAMLCCVAYSHATAPPKAATLYNTDQPILAPLNLTSYAFVMTPVPLLRQNIAITITNTPAADIAFSIAPVSMKKVAEITPAGKSPMTRTLPQCSQPDHPDITPSLNVLRAWGAII